MAPLPQAELDRITQEVQESWSIQGLPIGGLQPLLKSQVAALVADMDGDIDNDINPGTLNQSLAPSLRGTLTDRQLMELAEKIVQTRWELTA